jgi:phosphatidylinositol dimannoside acyltransferase
MIAYWLWRLANLLTRLVPLPIAYRVGGLMAELVYFCWREKRQNTIDNMRHVLGDGDEAHARAVARSSWRNYARYLIDFIRSPSIELSDVEDKFIFDGWSDIDAAFEHGKGIIFALMHFGSWDLGGALFSQRYPLNVITETFSHDKLNAMVVESRTTGGMQVIPVEKAGIGVLRALRRNEAIAILMDRPGAENGVRVCFFGDETTLPSGPARLALRTKARVIVAAVVRISKDSDRLLVFIEPNIDVVKTGDEQRDVRALTESILRAHERIIRGHPDQWYMFRRMWASGPG